MAFVSSNGISKGLEESDKEKWARWGGRASGEWKKEGSVGVSRGGKRRTT